MRLSSSQHAVRGSKFVVCYHYSDTHFIVALSVRSPTSKQLSDYTTEIVSAVRNSDLKLLKDLHAQGKR